MKKILTIILAFVLILPLVVNAASAQTLITGKVYDSGNNGISDALVGVTCHNSILDTITKDDGTYAVRFDVDKCIVGDLIQVSASKGSLSGKDASTVVACDNPSGCEGSEYISVLNVVIKSSSNVNVNANNGGSSNRFYFCGNNICDTGESTSTCPKDCPLNFPEKGVVALGIEENQNSNSGSQEENNIDQGNIVQEDENSNVGGGITGALVGFGKTNIGFGTIAVIILLIIAVLIALIRRMGKQSYREY